MTRNTTIAFLLFSTVYVLLNFIPDLRVHWMLKIFPIILLGIEVSKNETFKQGGALLGAIAASMTGDMLLHFDFFVLGLSAFLIAQIQYAFIFYQYRNTEKGRTGLTLMLTIYLVGMTVLLYPYLDDMMIPVLAYLVVISIMGFFAIGSILPLKWAVLGALFFILSDSLIAINKFIYAVPFERVLVMSTYYAAQWMLIKGFLENNISTDELEVEN